MGKKLTVDMAGVETRKTHPEGDYRFKVSKVEYKPGDEADNLVFVMKSDAGTLFHNCSLKKTALWKLKITLEALGITVPDGKFKLGEVDKDNLIHTWDGMELEGHVEHELYEGKKRARLTDMWPVGQGGDGDDEEEEGAGTSSDNDEGEDEEDETDPKAEYKAQLEAMDDEALWAAAKQSGVYAKKKDARKAGRATVIAKMVEAYKPETDDDDEEDDDEDE